MTFATAAGLEVQEQIQAKTVIQPECMSLDIEIRKGMRMVWYLASAQKTDSISAQK